MSLLFQYFLYKRDPNIAYKCIHYLCVPFHQDPTFPARGHFGNRGKQLKNYVCYGNDKEKILERFTNAVGDNILEWEFDRVPERWGPDEGAREKN